VTFPTFIDVFLLLREYSQLWKGWGEFWNSPSSYNLLALSKQYKFGLWKAKGEVEG